MVSGAAGTIITGVYGDLTIHQDGTYSYLRHAGSNGGASETFNYQLTDKDGDVSTTTLTVSIGNDHCFAKARQSSKGVSQISSTVMFIS